MGLEMRRTNLSFDRLIEMPDAETRAYQPEKPTLEEIESWNGRPVLDKDGRRVGTTANVKLIDTSTARGVEWIVSMDVVFFASKPAISLWEKEILPDDPQPDAVVG